MKNLTDFNYYGNFRILLQANECSPGLVYKVINIICMSINSEIKMCVLGCLLGLILHKGMI